MKCKLQVQQQFITNNITQAFPNSGKGWEGRKFTPSVGDLKFCQGNFLIEWWEPEEGWFWQFKPFSKLKTAFCEYWTSIKIKISTTCVSKEYEIKTKMVQEQWLQLNWVIIWKFLFSGGGTDFWWEGNKNL